VLKQLEYINLPCPLVTPDGLTGALFWDRRRPRLHTSPLRSVSGNECRRGRL